MAAPGRQQLAVLWLIFIYMDFSAVIGYRNNSWCVPVLVTKIKSESEPVSHFRMRTNGEVTEKKVMEYFDTVEIVQNFPEKCRPKCKPKCGHNADCVWKRPNRKPECQCHENFKPSYSADSKMRCLPQCNLKCGDFTKCVEPAACSCLDGYKRSENNGTNCEPFCKTPCGRHKSCMEPNTCGCDAGYMADKLGECQPICMSTICGEHEECTGPERCECSKGYAHKLNGTLCEPQCAQNCALNKYCARPEICECKAGYNQDPYGACQPVCKLKCGKNEQCIAPEHCDCLKGYTRLHTGVCEPECSKGYHRPTPDSLECKPICSGGCGTNAYCSDPGICKCSLGYQMNPSGVCEPICAPECEENSFCQSPGKCACKTGYFGEGNHCMPQCSIECGDNSYCARPDQCECTAGYTANDSGNRNCSSPTARYILILIGCASFTAFIGIASCMAFVFSRRSKTPAYVSHTDSGPHNVDLPSHDTTLEGIDNSSYI